MEIFFQKGLEYAVKLPAIYESMALPNCKEIRYIVFTMYFSTLTQQCVVRCGCKSGQYEHPPVCFSQSSVFRTIHIVAEGRLSRC